MNLVDNYRDLFGLRFSSKIYSENYNSTVIVNNKLPEFEYSFGAGKSLKQASAHIAIFAHTVNIYLNESTNEYEPCWNIKHADKILEAGLVKHDLVLGYITQWHFVEVIDEMIDACLSLNGNDFNSLSRFSSLLQATRYTSIDLALQYSRDDSFTDDMILRLGTIINDRNIVLNQNEDCEYVLKAVHELPEIYSTALLGT